MAASPSYSEAKNALNQKQWMKIVAWVCRKTRAMNRELELFSFFSLFMVGYILAFGYLVHSPRKQPGAQNN